MADPNRKEPIDEALDARFERRTAPPPAPPTPIASSRRTLPRPAEGLGPAFRGAPAGTIQRIAAFTLDAAAVFLASAVVLVLTQSVLLAGLTVYAVPQVLAATAPVAAAARAVGDPVLVTAEVPPGSPAVGRLSNDGPLISRAVQIGRDAALTALSS